MNRAARFIVVRATSFSSVLPVSSPGEKKAAGEEAQALSSAAPEAAASKPRRDVIDENLMSNASPHP